MKLLKTIGYTLGLSILFIASGCVKANFYQKNIAIQNGVWNSNQTGKFQVDITDTTAKYNIYFMIRHDESYPFNNIWIRSRYQAPGDTTFVTGERIDLLMSDVDGKWLGRNFGGMWEHRMLLINNANPIFKKAGTYNIEIEQLMRQEDLEGIMNIALQIEKVE